MAMANNSEAIAWEYARLVAAAINIADSPFHVTRDDIWKIVKGRGEMPLSRPTRNMLKSKLKPKKPVKWPAVPVAVPDTSGTTGENYDKTVTTLGH